MTKTILKYPLTTWNPQEVSMPAGAEVLCLQMQQDVPTLWALCDPAASSETRVFERHGTGWQIDDADKLKYVGTAQDGPFVWHIFERVA
jgi:hypothetical protein